MFITRCKYTKLECIVKQFCHLQRLHTDASEYTNIQTTFSIEIHSPMIKHIRHTQMFWYCNKTNAILHKKQLESKL